MLVNFWFFDKEVWSFYATLNVIIPLVLFKLLNFEVNSQAMIFMSLLAMMQGDLLPKILFTGFLNFMVFEPNREWVYRSCIYVLSIIVFHYIPMGHPVHKFVMDNLFMRYLLIAVIIVWMFPIMKPFVLWAKKELERLFKSELKLFK
mgnify:FL=1